MNVAQPNSSHNNRKSSINSSQDVWTRRFLNEGQLWGEHPSPPARYLTRTVLEHSSRIVEVGAGYGRDTNWFAENGHNVTAIDKASTALAVAPLALHEKIADNSVTYTTADFRRASLSAKSHDVFFSHRVLHLLGNNGITENFAKMAATVLKPEGTLLVTARNFKDFNKNQMKWVDRSQGVAEYRNDVEALGDRRGQTIYFWNKKKLTALFEDAFEGITFKEDQEMESVGNTNSDGSPVMTQYISILAKRKYTPNGNGH